MSRRRGFSGDEGYDRDAFDGDRKKSRLDESVSEPSKVVFVRQVPESADEIDVADLAIPFGRINNMVYARRKNQALIEMESLEDARRMVDYYERQSPVICGRACPVQFSNHQHLNMRSENNNVERAIAQANAQVGNGRGNSGNGYHRSHGSTRDADFNYAPRGSGSDEPSAVLHATMEGRGTEPINHLLIYKVFSRYGRVQRIIMFSKGSTEHALIEFQSSMVAMNAKIALHHSALLGGRFMMSVEFSKMSRLDVRQENEKCRDFERTPLSEMERCALSALSVVSDLVVESSELGLRGSSSRRYSPPPPPSFSSSHRSRERESSRYVDAYDSSMRRFSHPSLPPFDDYRAPRSDDRGERTSRYSDEREGNSVILVSNINDKEVEPDKLFILFGVYGDVERVKVMFNKKDTALVQFHTATQAATAREHLHNAVVWGQAIRIAYSHHRTIQMPREEVDVGLTKDYKEHPLHRFKTPNSINYKNIFPPNEVLHLSNIPLAYTEDKLKELFEKKGFTVTKFRFLQKDDSRKKMALVELPSVEDAISALMELHGHELDSSSSLRVSFSSRGPDRQR